MKEIRITVLVVGVILAAVVLSNALYTVSETEQVVVTQFGKPVGKPIMTPGLKLKMPFTQTVQRFEKRFMEWDGDPNQIPTKDKRFIWVDSYARWRTTDPLLFFQRLRDERGAQSRLDDILDRYLHDASAWRLTANGAYVQSAEQGAVAQTWYAGHA